MIRVTVLGIGLWSRHFANWTDFSAGVRGGDWASDPALRPAGIPTRELRRAPQAVKMSIEVAGQAVDMAGLDPVGLNSVFASAIGDMDITDYMCRMLADSPAHLSPTRFHNSVHNAPAGYWSISSGSHAKADSVCAFQHSAPMALMQGAIQASVDQKPVIVVSQDVAAPTVLWDIYPLEEPVAMALVLGIPGEAAEPIANVRLGLSTGSCQWPELPQALQPGLSSNPSAALLPLLAAVASGFEASFSMSFPAGPDQVLEVTLTPGCLPQ